jgi:hypothetical protein
MHKEEIGLSPKDKTFLERLGTDLFSSAMDSMQKSQCYSRYARYQNPSIVSARLSSTQMDCIQTKDRYKTSLLPISSAIKPKIVDFYNKYTYEHKNFKYYTHKRKFKKFSNENQPKNWNSLEITGLNGLHLVPVLEDPIKSRRKIEQEFRKNTISFMQKEKREKYYRNYNEKLKKISTLKLKKHSKTILNQSPEPKERFKPDDNDYNTQTYEISLQTPDNFNSMVSY